MPNGTDARVIIATNDFGRLFDRANNHPQQTLPNPEIRLGKEGIETLEKEDFLFKAGYYDANTLFCGPAIVDTPRGDTFHEFSLVKGIRNTLRNYDQSLLRIQIARLLRGDQESFLNTTQLPRSSKNCQAESIDNCSATLMGPGHPIAVASCKISVPPTSSHFPYKSTSWQQASYEWSPSTKRS